MRSTDGQKLGVSIITPYWNSYEKYLEDCLASIKSQTYKNYEVILINDCADLPTARNKGIKQAKGEYICILDVDNKLTPEYLEKTVGKGDIVATHLQFFGESNGTFQPSTNPTLEMFKIGNQIDANAIFKKKVWEDVGGYDENMKDGWEDYDFWVRCLLKGYQITVIPELLLLYRKVDESMSVTAGRKSAELHSYILNKIKLLA